MSISTLRQTDSEPARSALDEVFAQQRALSRERVQRPLAERLDLLERFAQMMASHEERLIDAITSDFGIRSREETLLTDLMLVKSELKFARRHLKRWMRPRRVKTDAFGLPGCSRLIPQPLGVVGILGTWNYPIGTTLAGAVGALAAGNRLIIKPSELAPRTAALTAEMVGHYFKACEIAVITGGPEHAIAISELPLDHLLFTGSPQTGRLVAAAAARNLTPVTLELGGKSPMIVDEDADFSKVARSLILGKFLNAGQTCIGADHAFVPRRRMDAFLSAMEVAVRRAYPSIENNHQYTSIINQRQYLRLIELLNDAREQGAQVHAIDVEGERYDAGNRRLPPTFVTDVSPKMRLMREEIFGPILPVIPYDTPDEVIGKINAGERPLALYWFGSNRRHRDQVIANTHAGGVTVNDCVLHVFQRRLPFGGIGQSGIGAYTGAASFERFSHFKPVYFQSRISAMGLLSPPYTSLTRSVLQLFERIL